MPATDVQRSADFYQKTFGWQIRRRGDGATAFDDTTGECERRAFVRGRAGGAGPGILFYVMVDSVAAAVEAAVANGAELVQAIGADDPEITARLRDPGGNVIGLYQEPSSAPKREGNNGPSASAVTGGACGPMSDFPEEPVLAERPVLPARGDGRHRFRLAALVGITLVACLAVVRETVVARPPVLWESRRSPARRKLQVSLRGFDNVIPFSMGPFDL